MTGPSRDVVEACLLRYTRGIDRLDGDLVASAFHPDAELEGYGRPGATTIDAFVERAIPSLRTGYRATQHRLSNISILSADASTALIESYVLAFHTRDNPDDPNGPDQLLTFNGRYIDRLSLASDEWLIAHRQLRVDWTRIETIDDTMPGDYLPGARDETDASYPS